MFKPRTIRGANGYDTKQASDDASPGHNNPNHWGPSLTIQSQAADADLNVIMERFGITGKMPENPRVPQYGDFTGINDYRTALEAVRNAHEAFMEIPAQVRARFDNDPQKFLEFTDNPANEKEMIDLKLAKPRPPETPPAPLDPVDPKKGTT